MRGIPKWPGKLEQQRGGYPKEDSENLGKRDTEDFKENMN